MSDGIHLNNNILKVQPEETPTETQEETPEETQEDLVDELSVNKSKNKCIKNGRYELINQIGAGAFSKVYKAIDHKTNKNVAVKIQHSGKYYNECAKDEINILKKLTKACRRKKTVNPPVINLLGSFRYKKHYVMVFPLYGDDLHSLKKRLFFENKRLPMTVIKHIFRQILRGCMFTHSIGLVHTDIKCENVLLQKPVDEIDLDKFPIEDFKVILTDYGTACEEDDHHTEYIQTLEMRSPEALFNGDWDYKVDIWSLGCLLFELLTYNTLFSLSSNPFPHYQIHDELSSEEEAYNPDSTSELPNKKRRKKDYSEESDEDSDDEDDFDLYLLLFKIQSLLGKPPLKPFESSVDFSTYYWCNVKEEVGYLKYYNNDTINHRPMRQILQKDYGYGKKIIKQVEPFMLKMLNWDPKKRSTAYELLQDPFMQ